MASRWSDPAMDSHGEPADFPGDSFDLEEPPSYPAHKPKDPRSTMKCNLLVRLFLVWMDPLFWNGGHLEQKDLYAHPEEADSRKLLHQFNRYWSQELDRKRRGKRPRLSVALTKCLWWRYLIEIVILFLELALMIGQAVVIGNLSTYFTIADPTDQETREAYLYSMGIVLMAWLISMFHAHALLIGQKLGMMARVITTGAIFQKMLTLSQDTIGEISTGHVINLASNDVQRFSYLFLFSPFLLVAPVHLVIFTYLAYNEVGWSAFLATGFIVLQIPVHIFLGQVFTKLRSKSAKETDKRVNVMNEVISGIRMIKMYAWEYAFRRVVAKLRSKESAIIVQGGLIRASNIALSVLSVTMTMFIIFSSYTATGGELSTKKVFTILSLLLSIRLTFFDLFLNGILQVSEAKVAVIRIQRLLETQELSTTTLQGSYNRTRLNESHGLWKSEGAADAESSAKVGDLSKAGSLRSSLDTLNFPMATNPLREKWVEEGALVKITHLSASWVFNRDKLVLQDITFEVNKDSSLLAVIGPVGAGKSSLLQCILGELKPMEGDVEIVGCLSYASQDPWVFSSTLRENVLFGLPYQRDWYNIVIEACALNKDITQLAQGDLTLVGERGVTLSGGQKARVNLARAVYREADVYVLDDPLSAVDTAVARHLFEKCIQGLLFDKIVVLATHQLQFAQQADRILVVKNGKMEGYGSYGELVEVGVDISQLLAVRKDDRDEFAYENEDDEETQEAFRSASMVELNDSDSTSILPHLPKKSATTDNFQGSFLDGTTQPVEDIPVPHEHIPFGTASIYSTPSMLSINSGLSEQGKENQDLLLSAPPEERAHGSISMATYYHFFRAGGNCIFLFIILFIFIVGEASVVVADWWLSDWAECSSRNYSLPLENITVQKRCTLSTKERITVYGILTGGAVIFSFARGVLFYYLCLNASRVLHNRMFGAVLRAPVLFFDSNPIGRVLNRFAKDVGFLDDLLPFVFTSYVMILLFLVAAILTSVVANVWVLIPASITVVAFLGIRWYFLRTLRDVKRLEAIARSPLYSHFSTTLQGLPTIRTFERESVAINIFHRYHNEHSQGWWLYIAGGRWFAIRIDTISTLFVAAVAFLAVPLASTLNAALVGLGLTYAISLADRLQYAVRLSADVENLMVSVERIMGYSKLEPEAPLETQSPHQMPPSEWPDKGEVVMEDVSFRYSKDSPLVLKSLCFSIKPGEKIGVVGRTGAGKSSLLSVLFRLAEPFGVVTIDGFNTKEIGLHDLRKSISIIPQDPVLFSGTVRYNLDPFNHYADEDLWNALEQVQLKPVVESLEGQLQSRVLEGGANFSVGQRQLMCLARALLRKNRILVLDEATANVDVKTDEIIQEAIREKFSQYTVLTIAHRLNTVMDSDRILVLNKGRVREFDSPHILLQDPSSQLQRMVEQTGPLASKKLYQMAEEAHIRRRELH